MTDHEFQQWYDHHLGCFPELRAWFKRNTPADATEESRPIQAWKRVLSAFPLGAAKEASGALLSGEITARGFSAHPAAIADYCRLRSSRLVSSDAPDRFPPCICTDGYLTIIDDERRKWAVLCTCPRGDHRAECHQKIGAGNGASPMRRYRECDVLEEEWFNAKT